MASMSLRIDTSDCSAAIGAVADLTSRLPWPARETFRAEVLRLFDSGRAIEFDHPARGPVVVNALASAELLDLMRSYEPKGGL